MKIKVVQILFIRKFKVAKISNQLTSLSSKVISFFVIVYSLKNLSFFTLARKKGNLLLNSGNTWLTKKGSIIGRTRLLSKITGAKAPTIYKAPSLSRPFSKTSPFNRLFTKFSVVMNVCFLRSLTKSISNKVTFCCGMLNSSRISIYTFTKNNKKQAKDTCRSFCGYIQSRFLSNTVHPCLKNRQEEK